MARTFQVRGTQGRPSWLPLFVFSRNTLTPRVVAHDEHLEIKIVSTSALPWSTITRVDVKPDLLRGARVILSSGGWDYLIHVDNDEVAPLLAELASHGVPLTQNALARRGG